MGSLQTGAAVAQASAPSEPGPVPEPQQVKVKGSYNARREDTASKTIVPHAEIMRYGDTSLLDVLKRLPSITVIAGQVRMRGLGEGYTQILLDGQKAPAGFSIESLAPDSVEKIEIVRSANAEMGTQAIAGTLNIVTKRSVSTARRDLKLSLGNEAGKAGPYWYWQDASRTGARSQTYSLSAAQSNFDSDGRTTEQHAAPDGKPESLIDGARHSAGVGYSMFATSRLDWKAQGGDTLSMYSVIRHMLNRNKMDDASSAEYGDGPMLKATHVQSRSAASIVSSNLNWMHRLGDKSTLDAKLGGSMSLRDNASHFLGHEATGATALARAVDGHTWDAELNSSGKGSSTLLERHVIVAGWDLASQRRNDQRRQDDLHTLPATSDKGPVTETTSVRVQRVALFVQDEWSLSARLSGYAGLRWEAVDTRSDGTVTMSSNNHSAVFSPILQTLWKLPDSENTQLRVALARTYKPPSVGSLNARRIVAVDNKERTPDYKGNPDLRPELAWGLDLAYEHFSDDGTMFSAGAYVRRIADIIGHSLTQHADQKWVAMPDNVGSATSSGIELEAKVNLQKLVADWPGIELHANLNRNWSSVHSVPGPNNRLASQTPFSANLGVDYALPGAGSSVGGNFSLQTGGPVRATLDETTYTSVARNLDLYGLWKIDKQRQVRVALANLLHLPNVQGSSYNNVLGSTAFRELSSNAASARVTFEVRFR